MNVLTSFILPFVCLFVSILFAAFFPLNSQLALDYINNYSAGSFKAIYAQKGLFPRTESFLPKVTLSILKLIYSMREISSEKAPISK